MIDTANKRKSMAQLGRPWTWFLFAPDNVIDAGDRFHLLHLYSGFAAAAAGACETFGWAGGTGGVTGGGTCTPGAWAGT